MILFFDTSALVKYFHKEAGTNTVIDLIDSVENQIWLLDIARVEFFSALSRRYRTKEIDKEQFDSTKNNFDNKSTLFNIITTDNAIVQLAENLIISVDETRGLRTLDALHLAAFIFSCEKDWKFITADQMLCNIVKNLGYEIINPL